MRKLYNEFLYIPKDGKIRDKVMLTRVATTVAIMLICLAAISITAYAYFSYNVTSGSYVLKSANFETKVEITDTNDVAVEVMTSNYKSHLATLEGGKEYKVTVAITDNCSANTGFLIITAEGCTNRYHTQQIYRDPNVGSSVIVFYITLNETSAVKFDTSWGTSSYFAYPDENNDLYILNEEHVNINIVRSFDAYEEDSQETTEADTTVTDGPETTTTVPEETTTTEAVDTTEPTPEPTPETTGPIEEETTGPEETTGTVTEPADPIDTTVPEESVEPDDSTESVTGDTTANEDTTAITTVDTPETETTAPETEKDDETTVTDDTTTMIESESAPPSPETTDTNGYDESPVTEDTTRADDIQESDSAEDATLTEETTISSDEALSDQ